jgi:hypothetical protein
LNDLRSMKGFLAFKIEKCSDNGCPDVFFTSAMTGAVLIEVKAPGEKPSPLQNSFMFKLWECGTRAFWVETWEEWVNIKRYLRIGY